MMKNTSVGSIAVVLMLALLLLVFLALSIAGLFTTTLIDVDTPLMEEALFVPSLAPLNLGVLLLAAFCFIRILRPGSRFSEKINIKAAAAAMLCFTVLIGAMWVMAVKCVPTADSGRIFQAASGAAAGDFTPMLNSDYFFNFPYQLGFTAVMELIIRLLGSESYMLYGLVNVFFLTMAYAAITALSHLIFGNRSITLITILLLGLCIQPMLFCTFLYGNVLGLAASMWAAYFTVRYFRTGKKRFISGFAVLLALAVLAKQNYWLAVIAVCAALLLHALRTRRYWRLPIIALCVLLPVLAVNSVKASYEARSGESFGPATPLTAWLAMGLQESPLAPGWFNGYTYDIMRENGYDTERARETINKDISESLHGFARDPVYALGFFGKKTLSQWNEPQFQSIWVSMVMRHDGDAPAPVQDVYYGVGSWLLRGYFKEYTLIVYWCFVAGLLFALLAVKGRKRGAEKNHEEELILLPLIILGAFVYHLLFEGKAQYMLVYLPMMIPFCAFGVVSGYVDLRAFICKREWAMRKLERWF